MILFAAKNILFTIVTSIDIHGDKVGKQEEKAEVEAPIMLFAPDCIYKNGKYYLYFCLSDNREGVAVDSSVTRLSITRSCGKETISEFSFTPCEKICPQ